MYRLFRHDGSDSMPFTEYVDMMVQIVGHVQNL